MQQFDPHIPKRHRSVIPLQHDRPKRRFGVVARTPCWPGHFHVLLDQLAVLKNFDESTVFSFFARIVKTRRTKRNIKTLPFTWALARVDERRMAADTLRILPTLIDAAAVAVFQ